MNIKSNKWWQNLWYKITHRREGVYYSEDGMDQKHVCANCGLEYEGQFCPRCSQKAGVKRFTFRNVFDNFLEVFDYNNRNVLKTVVELCYRPGYMIRDYITGHRASYYPPIKLLFFVCVLYAVVYNFDFVKKDESTREDLKKGVEASATRFSNEDVSVKDISAKDVSTIDDTIKLSNVTVALPLELKEGADNETNRKELEKLSTKAAAVVDWFLQWTKNNRALSTLASIFLLSFFCRMMFRKAPYGPFNLTEHFFALVYVNCALMLFASVYLLIVQEYSDRDIGILPLFISFPYCVIAYKQLFGYKWIATIFRMIAVQMLNLLATFILIVLFFVFYVLFMQFMGVVHFIA